MRTGCASRNPTIAALLSAGISSRLRGTKASQVRRKPGRCHGASIQQHALTRICLLNLVRNKKTSMRFRRSQRLSAPKSSLRGCCANLPFACWVSVKKECYISFETKLRGLPNPASPHFHDLAIWLEAQLQAELQVARVQRGDSFAEQRIRDLVVRRGLRGRQ
jgi:hypothetical protein